ncbi:tyrosine-type recombinase/integrase [Nitrosococcus wardiae]|uniref:Site-specific integrase n=1 Tax=Nitrosococcus wardiae TaxID=1814290 RepID=A0A4P7C5E4_9GAMM|nr:site-specific integrase [Nitrosococcus wardiae]QBQ56226.1 site-specific integrase [Nitrosococcus wardiae]
MNFTDRAIRALKSQDQRYEVLEDGRTGLRLRVSTAGRKSWLFTYRKGGKLNRITLGVYPEMSLAQAREEVSQRRSLLNRGLDPAHIERTHKEEERQAPTMAQLAELYLERYAKAKKRSWREDERLLKKDVLPRWGHRKAKDIVRRDVVMLLDDIIDRGSPIVANRTLACVRKMFNYALERSLIEMNPCSAVKMPGKERKRDRVLNEEEIRTFWHGLKEARILLPIRLALQLQLVTAQRKGELIRAEWSHFDFASGWWTIPAERTKNHLAHRVPLSPLALESIEGLRGFHPLFLFPSRNGEKPLLDTSIDHAVRKNLDVLGITPFTPHDLRRTAASHMTGMGISRLVVSKILNHAENGVTAVYDRHSYDPEKRQALEAWGKKLEAIIRGKESNPASLAAVR